MTLPSPITPERTGLLLPYPRCGDDKAEISFRFTDETFVCSSCSEEFTAANLRAAFEAWFAVLTWVDKFPRK